MAFSELLKRCAQIALADVAASDELEALIVSTIPADDSVSTVKLQNGAVDATKLGAGSVVLAKLAAAVVPGLMVMKAGDVVTVGGAAAEDITLAGVVGTDTVIAFIRKPGAVPRTLDTIAAGTGKITLTFSGNPSSDHYVGYLVLRAPA